MARVEASPSGDERAMITAIELTSVKGIAEEQRIELAPISVLFGPMSACVSAQPRLQ